MIDLNIDHDRANYAYKCIEEIKQIDRLETKYRSAVRSCGALIQKSGLIQTLSFYLSKKNEKTNEITHYEKLAEHILMWEKICGNGDNRLDSYKKLLTFSDEQLICKTQEAKDVVLWLKRFSDTMLKGEPGEP